MIRRHAVLALVGITLVACAGHSPNASPPQALEGVVAGWHQLGLTCKAQQGIPNSPAEWQCQGTLEGVNVVVAMDVGEAGMLDLLAQLPASAGRSPAIRSISELIEANPQVGAIQDVLIQWLEAWDGKATTGSSGSASFRLTTEGPWILFQFVPDAANWPPPDIGPMCTDGTSMVCA